MAERQGKVMKILVVDDNGGAQLLVLYFQAIRHEADFVCDSTQVLSKALEMNPDVILLDIGMPVMSGWDVAKQLRTEPRLQKTFISALSAYSDPSDIQRSLESGMDHHFIKPLDLDDFWKVVQGRNGK